MGGTVALSYTIRHQERLRALILSGPLAALEAAPAPLRMLGRVLSVLAPQLPLISIDASLVSRDPEVVRDYVADPLNHHGKLPARTLDELARAIDDFPEAVTTITLPMLILYGTDDGLAPPVRRADARSPDRLVRQDDDPLPGPVPRDPQRARARCRAHRYPRMAGRQVGRQRARTRRRRADSGRQPGGAAAPRPPARRRAPAPRSCRRRTRSARRGGSQPRAPAGPLSTAALASVSASRRGRRQRGGLDHPGVGGPPGPGVEQMVSGAGIAVEPAALADPAGRDRPLAQDERVQASAVERAVTWIGRSRPARPPRRMSPAQSIAKASNPSSISASSSANTPLAMPPGSNTVPGRA